MALATTTPVAAAVPGLPLSALMSMPRCQPLRRRPNVEVTGPSLGHTNASSVSKKSGTARIRLTGPFRIAALADRGPPLGRSARGPAGCSARAPDDGGAGGAALAAEADGITSRWPSRSRADAPGSPLVVTRALTVTPYRLAIPLSVSPETTTCTPGCAGGASG